MLKKFNNSSVLHILAADAEDDVDSVRSAAATGSSIDWIVPKRARIGERALFHLPGVGIAVRGMIATGPRASRPGRNEARVEKISMLRTPAPLAFLRKHHPSWEWPTYPKSYTTIDGQIELKLEWLLKSKKLENWLEEIVEGARLSS